MNITYREINRLNLEELRFVAEQDSRVPLLFDPEYSWNESAIESRVSFYTQQIAEKDFFEVAVLQDHLIGFHIVKKVPYPPDLLAGVIVTLWVDERHRGMGVATTLKKRAEEWAKKENLFYLQTNVHPNNSQMLSINKKHGFEVTQFILRKRVT